MEHYQIRYFLAVCRTLNFTRASEEVAVSQPALTKAVQKLEEELGAPLFLRQGRRVSITDFGKLMREKLEEVVQARSAAELAARQFLGGKRLVLNIGVMCTIGPASLVGLIARFRLDNPDMEIKLQDVAFATATDGIRSGKLDAVIHARSGSAVLPPGMNCRRLFSERMMVAFSPDHRFAAMRQVPFEELDGENYIDRLHCEFRDMFVDEIKDREMEMAFPYASEREDWIHGMIAGGLGVCMLPEFTIDEPGIQRRPIVKPDLKRSVELVYARGQEKQRGLCELLACIRKVDWPDSAG